MLTFFAENIEYSIANQALNHVTRVLTSSYQLLIKSTNF